MFISKNSIATNPKKNANEMASDLIEKSGGGKKKLYFLSLRRFSLIKITYQFLDGWHFFLSSENFQSILCK